MKELFDFAKSGWRHKASVTHFTVRFIPNWISYRRVMKNWGKS